MKFFPARPPSQSIANLAFAGSVEREKEAHEKTRSSRYTIGRKSATVDLLIDSSNAHGDDAGFEDEASECRTRGARSASARSKVSSVSEEVLTTSHRTLLNGEVTQKVKACAL